jgi:hypothetical protein
MEKGILMLQLLKLAWNGGVALSVCGQMHTLLLDSYGGIVLQVEQVLHVHDYHSHAGIEVGALKI